MFLFKYACFFFTQFMLLFELVFLTFDIACSVDSCPINWLLSYLRCILDRCVIRIIFTKLRVVVLQFECFFFNSRTFWWSSTGAQRSFCFSRPTELICSQYVLVFDSNFPRRTWCFFCKYYVCRCIWNKFYFGGTFIALKCYLDVRVHIWFAR